MPAAAPEALDDTENFLFADSAGGQTGGKNDGDEIRELLKESHD